MFGEFTAGLVAQTKEYPLVEPLTTTKQTWLGKIFINRKHQRLGHLSKNDALHLAKEVKDASKARVRVVDAIPKHLSVENKDSVYISVWLKQ